MKNVFKSLAKNVLIQLDATDATIHKKMLGRPSDLALRMTTIIASNEAMNDENHENS